MAHCVNCDVLISDRPDHGDFCSPECAAEYVAGANQERLTASGVHDLVVNTSNEPVNTPDDTNSAVNNSKDTNEKP